MSEKPFTFTLLMILAMLLWGGGWTALKIATDSVGVEVLTLWRFIIMFLSFLPIIFFLKTPLRLPRKGLKYILGSSVLNVFFMLFAYLGVKYSTAGSGGVIITILSPLFTFLLSLLIFRHLQSSLQYFGLILGLIGGIIMLNLPNIDPALIFKSAEFYFVLAALTWAAITLLSQRSHLHINPIHYSFFISMFSMLILFVLTVGYDISVVFEQDRRFWLSLLYLSIFGQSVATTIFFIASGRLGSEKASSFMFLVPLFAVLISFLVLDEKIQMHVVLGGVVSLIAVYFINKRARQ